MQLRSVVLGALVLALCACSRDPAPREAANTRRLSGLVVERLDAPPYSFLRLELEQGEAWVAVPVGTAASGQRVELVNGVVLRGYDARAIGKRFDEVVFGTVAGR